MKHDSNCAKCAGSMLPARPKGIAGVVYTRHFDTFVVICNVRDDGVLVGPLHHRYFGCAASRSFADYDHTVNGGVTGWAPICGDCEAVRAGIDIHTLPADDSFKRGLLIGRSGVLELSIWRESTKELRSMLGNGDGPGATCVTTDISKKDDYSSVLRRLVAQAKKYHLGGA